MPAADILARRGLFSYADGMRDRIGDALVIQLRLQQACPGGDIRRLGYLLDASLGIFPGMPDADADADIPEATPPPMTPEAAMVELADLVGAGFDLPPFSEEDGSGLSVQERAELLGRFFARLAPDSVTPEDADAAADPTDLDATDAASELAPVLGA